MNPNFFKFVPSPIYDLLISFFNSYQIRYRRGGNYVEYKSERSSIRSMTSAELDNLQLSRLNQLISYAKVYSPYYNKILPDNVNDINDLQNIPLLSKNILLNDLDNISTVGDSGVPYKTNFTGGTTGNSMKTFYTLNDINMRHAILDDFRESHGFTNGSRVCWFTGKNFISKFDLMINRFYKDDYFNQIRFYSTFHLSPSTFSSYISSLNNFKPQFLVGFPSFVYELALYVKSNHLSIDFSVDVFFPTAETILPHHRELISEIFSCEILDQYASSEGAPFIFECSYGHLHADTSTGVFEVLDENNNPANTGRLIVTSFSTYGTPLIRYDIGDTVSLSKLTHCNCGSNFPIIQSIDGRQTDSIILSDGIKVNQTNICNSVKGIVGINRFQIEQLSIHDVNLFIEKNSEFNDSSLSLFLRALNERFNNKLEINVIFKEVIGREKSGKYRIVKSKLS